MQANEIKELAQKITTGDRRAIARGITLTESSRVADAAKAEQLQQILRPPGKTIRIGVSGPPGAGKSTLIETLGLHWISKGHRPAVLTIDPSSSISGGSLLGDKSRMERLAAAPEAFIRPSPAGGFLGGVNRKTRETIQICEAAGYDIIIIETVGVGQQELAVANMVDFFLLVLLPNAGDEIQGIKKGILELADCIAVNKADLDHEAALRTASELKLALRGRLSRVPDWELPILTISALENDKIETIPAQIHKFQSLTEWERPDGRFQQFRKNQYRDWMWDCAREQLLASFDRHPAVLALSKQLEQAVICGELSPTAAAQKLLEIFRSSEPKKTQGATE